MPSVAYLLAGVGIAAAITFALRLIPFAVTGRARDSALISDLSRWMPVGAVVVLAVYCLSRVDYAGPVHGVPELAGVAATVGAHLWRRNAVLSIVAGTAVCVGLSYALG